MWATGLLGAKSLCVRLGEQLRTLVRAYRVQCKSSHYSLAEKKKRKEKKIFCPGDKESQEKKERERKTPA